MVCVAIFAVLLFARTYRFEFLLWDDDQHITANARLDPPTLGSLASFWRASFLGLYVPLSYTLFWLEACVTQGPDPRVFHALSVALHAVNAALVVGILVRLGARPWGAMLGGLLFAVHPLQVESVAWVSEQRGLLAAAFGLGALLVYVGPRRGPRTDLVLAALFLGALLAKPVAVVVPLMAIVLELFVLRRRMRFALPRLGAGVLASALALIVTSALQSGELAHEVVSIPGRPLVAADALEFYVRKLFVPIGLAADHGRRPTLVLAHGVDGTLVLTMLALAVLLAVPALRRHALVPIALFVAVLSPVLGLVPFGHQELSTVADRYAYLALLGPAYFVARAWPDRGGPNRLRRASAIVAVAVVGILSAASFVQAEHWRSTDAVFARMLEVNPRSWVAHTNRGLALQSSGDLAGARREYEAAIHAKPDHARALNNLGVVLVQTGSAEEGEALVRRAAEVDPKYARPHMNLAAILGNAGKLEEAEVSARRALELAPEDATMYAMLGNVHLRQSRPREALADFQNARSLRARDVEAWVGIGLAQKALGDLDAAEASLNGALELARARSPARVRQIEAELQRLRAP